MREAIEFAIDSRNICVIRGILLGQLVWYGKILVRWGRTRDGFVCAPGIRDARFSCRSSALVVVRPYLVGTMLLGKFGFKFDKLPPCEQLYSAIVAFRF